MRHGRCRDAAGEIPQPGKQDAGRQVDGHNSPAVEGTCISAKAVLEPMTARIGPPASSRADRMAPRNMASSAVATSAVTATQATKGSARMPDDGT